MKRYVRILSCVFLSAAFFACLEEDPDEEEARNLAILAGQVDAEQAGGSARIAFRNEYDPGSCPAWFVNIQKDDDTKSVISSTTTGDTSASVSAPAPEVYDMDIECANGSGGSVTLPAQAVENARSYLLHYKSDGNISFAEYNL